MECPGDLETRRGSLAFAWDLRFLLVIRVGCVSSQTYRSGSEQDRVHTSFISRSFPEARGLGVQISSVCGLEQAHDTSAQSFLRYHLLCWKTPKISSSLYPLERGHTLR